MALLKFGSSREIQRCVDNFAKKGTRIMRGGRRLITEIAQKWNHIERLQIDCFLTGIDSGQ